VLGVVLFIQAFGKLLRPQYNKFTYIQYKVCHLILLTIQFVNFYQNKIFKVTVGLSTQ